MCYGSQSKSNMTVIASPASSNINYKWHHSKIETSCGHGNVNSDCLSGSTSLPSMEDVSSQGATQL